MKSGGGGGGGESGGVKAYKEANEPLAKYLQ